MHCFVQNINKNMFHLKIHDYISFRKMKNILVKIKELKKTRPFLRKYQGLGHYQAPPKRRQPRPKTHDASNNNTKNEVKKILFCI